MNICSESSLAISDLSAMLNIVVAILVQVCETNCFFSPAASFAVNGSSIPLSQPCSEPASPMLEETLGWD